MRKQKRKPVKGTTNGNGWGGHRDGSGPRVKGYEELFANAAYSTLRRRVQQARALAEASRKPTPEEIRQEKFWNEFVREGEKLHAEREAVYRVSQGTGSSKDKRIAAAWKKRIEESNRQMLEGYERRREAEERLLAGQAERSDWPILYEIARQLEACRIDERIDGLTDKGRRIVELVREHQHIN